MKLFRRFAFGLLTIAAMAGAVVSAQSPCLGSSGLGGKGTLNQQTGIRTIKVMVASDLSGGTKDAADAAIAAWNAETSTTKIHFQKVSSGGDVSISKSTAMVQYWNAICGVGWPGGNVYLESGLDDLGDNPSSTTGGRTNASILQYIVTHELGHTMNLQQTQNAGSIMDGLGGGSNCIDGVTNYMPSTTTIQSTDAQNARDCANRSDPVPDDSGGSGASQENGPCFDVYWVTIWFSMDENGDWQVDSIHWDYLYTTCDENPYPQ